MKKNYRNVAEIKAKQKSYTKQRILMNYCEYE